MKFDRTAPGGGVEVSCSCESGRAYLQWRFFYTEAGYTEAGQKGRLFVFVRDAQGQLALECVSHPREEETMRSILLQPHLWKGTKDPYLYSLEALLLDEEGNCRDRMTRRLALYCLSFRGELYLNGERFEERAVRYRLPEGGSSAQLQGRVAEDLRLLLEMGANSIHLEDGEGVPEFFPELCERFGFLVRLTEKERDSGLSVYRGGESCLVSPEGALRGEFYRNRARWGREPFVYLVPESVRRRENGRFSSMVYSNCARVALYSDGILHEFRSGCCEFPFREIEAKGPYLSLVAEAEGARSALTLHKSVIPTEKQL